MSRTGHVSLGSETAMVEEVGKFGCPSQLFVVHSLGQGEQGSNILSIVILY